MEIYETKKCPYCGEKIKSEAQKCRYCGEWLLVNRDHIQSPTQFKQNEENNQKSKKAIIWAVIGLLAVIAGTVVAITITKTQDSDVKFNNENQTEAKLSDENRKETEKYAERHGHTEDIQDWEILYMRDEFGEEVTSMPYAQRTISGYKIFGQSGQTNYRNLVFILDPRFGMKLHIVDNSFMGSDRILIKHSSGKVEEIPYESLDDGDIVISSPNTIKRFVDILAKGNVEMAIAVKDNRETRSWRFVINDEFKSIRKALRLFRDVPNAESIYGTID